MKERQVAKRIGKFIFAAAYKKEKFKAWECGTTIDSDVKENVKWVALNIYLFKITLGIAIGIKL